MKALSMRQYEELLNDFYETLFGIIMSSNESAVRWKAQDARSRYLRKREAMEELIVKEEQKAEAMRMEIQKGRNKIREAAAEKARKTREENKRKREAEKAAEAAEKTEKLAS